MNSAKPIYVTFEQAKLLKQKEFNLRLDGTVYYKESCCKPVLTWCEVSTYIYNDHAYWYAPQQHQVVEWLRTKHGIWIQVEYSWKEVNGIMMAQYFPRICGKTGQLKIFEYYKSPQKAYSAAFDHVLVNLI